jgi:hypothetical protein
MLFYNCIQNQNTETMHFWIGQYCCRKSKWPCGKTYDRLNTEFKRFFHFRAILRQGLVYYNTDKDDQALAKFKKWQLIFRELRSAWSSCNRAIDLCRQWQSRWICNWVRTLDFVAVTDAELDNDTYQGAENNFNKTTPSKAIAGFNGYINQFPRGIHALQANYYLAQLHYAEGAESKSIPMNMWLQSEANLQNNRCCDWLNFLKKIRNMKSNSGFNSIGKRGRPCSK